MTGKPDKLASALLKISGKIKVIPPKELENVQKLNAFFIIPALSGSSIANLFSTSTSGKASSKTNGNEKWSE